jgi:hypothetical protein
MESLELETLLVKIAGRAEDLVKADTISMGVLDSTQKLIRYLGVFGNRMEMLKDMDMPLESVEFITGSPATERRS